jgi:hypothetical protein
MIFAATRLEDAWPIDIRPRQDERAFFARTWYRQELAAQDLDTESLGRACRLTGTAARYAARISSDRRMTRSRSCDARVLFALFHSNAGLVIYIFSSRGAARVLSVSCSAFCPHSVYPGRL